MSVSMVSNKSTRWDCDVSLWRGIPDSFPSFHGWRRVTPERPSHPVRDPRFFACHHCNNYVPEVDVPNHPCWDYPRSSEEQKNLEKTPLIGAEPSNTESSDDGYMCDWNDWRKKEEEAPADVAPKYVIATDENSIDGRCPVCTDRLVLQFDQDEEEWVYPGCISVDGRAVHEECHLVAFG